MRVRSILTLLALAAPLPVAAQSALTGDAGVGTGIIYREYTFGSTYPIKDVMQYAVPIGVVIPIGQRFTVDIGSYYASTTVHDAATGNGHTLNGFTDTQLRGSYVLGHDLVVLSLMLNLPSGQETQTLEEIGVSSAIASNFLLFPVASYGNGFSGTLGSAVAFPAGAWNLGLSVSGRLSAKYQPYADSGLVDQRYEPGFEGRIRAGVDRLIGSSRLAVAFTYSTFSDDQFNGGTTAGKYSPSPRYISQASLTSPLGSSSLSLYAWDYYRSGSSDDATPGATKENVFTGGAQLAIPAGKTVSIEPLAEVRLLGAAPANGTGLLVGLGANARIQAANRFTIVPGARYDTGHIESDVVGKPSVNGFEGSLRLRYSF
jgi:hypothetical protein